MSIIKNKKICGGNPTIKGTRITVQSVLSFLHSGKSVDDIVCIYNKYENKINKNDVQDAIRYSIKKIENVR